MSQLTPSSQPAYKSQDDLLRRVRDLEERCRRAEDALRALEEHNRLLGDSAPFGILVVDSDGGVFGTNQKLVDMLAWPSDQDIKHLNVLKSPLLVTAGVAEVFQSCIDKKKPATSDHVCVSNVKEGVHLRFQISPVIDPHGRFNGLIAFVEDVTELKLAEEALRKSEQRFRVLAMRDNLTGLYNRRYLYQSLTDLVDRARINQSVISVIFMDLDNFKTIVDTHGHLNGSRAIKEVGETIRQTLEKPAYAVAYAGDEFVVVLPGFDPDQAMEQARHIQTRINDQVFLRVHGLEIRIQSSFGIATFPLHADDMTDLLAAADHALFEAKGTGKNTIRSLDLSDPPWQPATSLR